MLRKLAFRLRADDGPTLNAGLVALLFLSIVKKPFISVISQTKIYTSSFA